MAVKNIISSEDKTVELSGLKSLLEFSNFNMKKPELFLEGMELSEDLENIFGATLYTRGTKITTKHIAKLLELCDMNPNLDFTFKIKLSIVLIQFFRHEIKDNFLNLFNNQKKTKVYSKFLSKIEVDIEHFIDDILKDENTTIALYGLRFNTKSTEKTKTELFFEHPINVALLALAIAKSDEYKSVIGEDKNRLIDLCKVAMFHNYGALQNIENIMKIDERKRFQAYWAANLNGYSEINKNLFEDDIFGSFYLISKYYFGKNDVLKKNDWPALLANIIIVADIFICEESGLFGNPRASREVVNSLNVMAVENEISKLPVYVLTNGLHFKDIFLFFIEVTKLIKECPFDSATPYPLDKNKTPTVFVCRKEVKKCPYLDPNRKSVKLVKPLGELAAGDYRLCRLLSPKLKTFYKDHYLEIKRAKQ
ncbi:HD domain-containing protein [Candidatus Latescibacterota bacterium]